LGIGFAKLAKGCILPCGKKGLKAQRIKVDANREKPKEKNLQMLRPGIPEKAIKGFSTRNGGTHKIRKSRPSWRIRGLIMSQPIRFMGMQQYDTTIQLVTTPG
jgi:hypothetical protein